MESVLIAEAQANLWEKCADVYSDHIFYTHKLTGDVSWDRPTIATYLPPGFMIPDPPDPLPAGVSIDTTSEESEKEGKPVRRKKKQGAGAGAGAAEKQGMAGAGSEDGSDNPPQEYLEVGDQVHVFYAA